MQSERGFLMSYKLLRHLVVLGEVKTPKVQEGVAHVDPDSTDLHHYRELVMATIRPC